MTRAGRALLVCLWTPRGWNPAVLGLWLCALAAPALAQVDPNSGLDFARITSPGNPAYQSINPNDFVNGRGGVSYEYSIAKTEVPTSLWVQFFNAAFDRPADDRLPYLIPPDSGHWGAAPTTPNTPGGLRWAVPAGNENRAVGDISWRMAAMFCNWLSNGKSSDRSAFMSGAYDVSTFGYNGAIFTDQLAHTPGATYWIPTWDEWLKAAHWSPSNLNNGGWYTFSNGSDDPYVYGPPGVGQADAGFSSPNPFSIPLGSYATVSPWGLYDVAGETTEWTESIFTVNTGQRYRIYEGSWWTDDPFQAFLSDSIQYRGGDEYPHIASYEFGLRIASSVPAPGPWALGAGVLSILGLRRVTGGTEMGSNVPPSRRGDLVLRHPHDT